MSDSSHQLHIMQWEIELPELSCSDEERESAHRDYGKQAVELGRRALIEALTGFTVVKVEFHYF